MNRSFGAPLALSVIGHCCVVALLVLLVGRLPPTPLLTPPKPQIEVILAPAEPPPPPIPQALPPPVPPPAPPVVETAPPPPPRPPPEPRVAVKRPPPVRRPVRRVEREPRPVYRPPLEAVAPPPPTPPPNPPMQTAALPPPAPPRPQPIAPVVSGAYRTALSAWFAGHKEYPESARERGEEGRGLLRFRVDRSGRVLSYTLVQSTGHPDLDAAIDRMMRGASLPPFPADMASASIEVTVPIRFGLVR